MRDPERELVRLGVPLRGVSYWDLLNATALIAEDRLLLTNIVKEVYVPIAKMRHVKWGCVEVSMRRAIKRIWQKGNRRLLQRIMHRVLPEPPTVGEFLGAFVFYLNNSEPVIEGLEKEVAIAHSEEK